MTPSLTEQVLPLFQTRDFESAHELLGQILKQSLEAVGSDLWLEALVLTAMAWRLQGQAKKALKFYKEAEALSPDETSLKVVISQILLFEFNQAESAERKLKGVDVSQADAVTRHQVLSLRAACLLKRRQKEKAWEEFKQAWSIDPGQWTTASGFDFKTLERFVNSEAKRAEIELALKVALQVAQQCREDLYQSVLQGLIEFSQR